MNKEKNGLSPYSFLPMPSNIYLNHKCINQILNSYFEIESTSRDLILDFSNTIWISAEVTPLLGVLLGHAKEQGHGLYSTGINNENVRRVLEKNNFLSTYGIGEKTNDYYQTTIPYTVLDCRDDLAIDQFLDNKVFNLIHQHIDQNSIEVIRSAVNEVSHNIKDHSNESLVYFCGQFYPKKKFISLTLTDNGLTIPKKIKYKFSSKLNYDDYDVINWATGHGNSTKNVASSGLGLYDIKTNLNGIGKLIIVSNKGYWEQNINGRISKKSIDTYYPGTLININFKINNHLKPNVNQINDIIKPNDSLLF